MISLGNSTTSSSFFITYFQSDLNRLKQKGGGGGGGDDDVSFFPASFGHTVGSHGKEVLPEDTAHFIQRP